MTSPTTFDSATLQARRGDDDVRIIDVRTPAEFETVHIPGAYNVPLQNIGEHRLELARHLDETVVLVCQSGNRAREAEKRLAEAGMSNVHVLDGGMQAWQKVGGDVRRGRQRWSLERQVRGTAGAIVLSSILASIAVPELRWLAGAVGAGLTFSALTDTCAMGSLLAKLPYNKGVAGCDIDAVVDELIGAKRKASGQATAA